MDAHSSSSFTNALPPCKRTMTNANHPRAISAYNPFQGANNGGHRNIRPTQSRTVGLCLLAAGNNCAGGACRLFTLWPRRRFWRRIVASIVVLIAGTAVEPPVSAAGSAPHFQGDSLPDPPARNRPFTTTKTKLPQAFLTATAALFDLGLADPRDCEYREVWLAIGDRKSGDGGVVKVHAWAFPPGASDVPKGARFAVAWNGLVYPVVTVGEKARLSADVEAQCKEDDAARTQRKKDRPNEDLDRFGIDFGEDVSVSEHDLLPIKACLLLRLGETSLAERVWQHCDDAQTPDP